MGGPLHGARADGLDALLRIPLEQGFELRERRGSFGRVVRTVSRREKTLVWRCRGGTGVSSGAGEKDGARGAGDATLTAGDESVPP